MMKAFTTGPFTGRHFTAIIVCFFAVVVAVNILMARLASSTFGGVVVENSYVASQNFNRWLGEAGRAKALGWSAKALRDGHGKVRLTLAGAPAGALIESATARHPLGRMPDRAVRFLPAGEGSFVSDALLPEGRWRLRIVAAAGTARWKTELDLP